MKASNPRTPFPEKGKGAPAGAAAWALAGVSLSVWLASATWFSGTAAAGALAAEWGLSPAQAAGLTTSVQWGFITGTFLYALLNLADRFNPRGVFAVSALLGAGCNAIFALLCSSLPGALFWRFLTGFTLAGIYPVGMKLVAGWYRSGLGWRLGIMVGALTMGTATPYLLQALGKGWEWRLLAGASSLLACGGALLLGLVPEGPHLRERAPFRVSMMWRVFQIPAFRHVALGYFGHMWELYAVWSLVGFYLAARPGYFQEAPLSIPMTAFLMVGCGALGCVGGGWLSLRLGEVRVARLSLMASGTLSLSSAFFFSWHWLALLGVLLLWGVVVVSDSPQFSALAARYCPPEYTGTALTIQNGIGFAVTTLSIQLIPWLVPWLGWKWALVPLALGPWLGVLAVGKLPREVPPGI